MLTPMVSLGISIFRMHENELNEPNLEYEAYFNRQMLISYIHVCRPTQEEAGLRVRGLFGLPA
jgi:hypothetical protein